MSTIIENPAVAADMTPVRLSRALPGTPPAPPVRIVHLGIGNFHRAHQAWYTAHAGDAGKDGGTTPAPRPIAGGDVEPRGILLRNARHPLLTGKVVPIRHIAVDAAPVGMITVSRAAASRTRASAESWASPASSPPISTISQPAPRGSAGTADAPP